MPLKDRLTEDMQAAMKAGDKPRLSVLRMALAGVKQREDRELRRLRREHAREQVSLEVVHGHRRDREPVGERRGP